MRVANLAGANLWDAKLAGANLQGANLAGANLQGATYDEQTMLPDVAYQGEDDNGNPIYDKYWTPDTDMARYTDPEHRDKDGKPDFWQPDWAAAGFTSAGAWVLAGMPVPNKAG